MQNGKKLDWSPQQAAFLDWCSKGNGSCVLQAVAGAGKTTVLLAGGEMIRGQVAYVAYNKKIVDETKEKLAARNIDWKKMQAGTAHSFGYSAYKKARNWSKEQASRAVDENKVNIILDAVMPAATPMNMIDHPLRIYAPAIKQMVSLAKQHMFGVLEPLESFDGWANIASHYDVFSEEDGVVPLPDIVNVCIEALTRSNNQLDLIDYDDMIYLPLLHRCRFWQFDVVMVDEAQDTNAARRALVRAMLKKGGRVVAVGDPHQAIYGFTGADSDALDLIAKDFACIKLDLTVTFRCPKAVVDFARQWVKHITAADTAPQGKVSRTSLEDFFKRNDLTVGSAVLCRVTKPLVALAFNLIRRRIPCRIEGREVGKAIQKLMTRWKVTTLNALEEKIDNYLARETTKLLAKKQEAKLAQVEDMVETVRVIIDQCRKDKKTEVVDAVAYIDGLFGDNVKDVIVLSTIHKSKGREWPRVFWLDRLNTCPSKWARQEWQKEQENNLCYVAATRAQEELIELDLPLVKKENGK